MGPSRTSRRGRRFRDGVQPADRPSRAVGAPAARRGPGPISLVDEALRQGEHHNGLIPREHWLTAAEREAILEYHDTHPLESYRRLAYMMIDADVVALRPATDYRVLRAAGVIDRWKRRASRQGTGFVQPLRPHEHWHIAITYINIAGTFYYLCAILDGASRFLVHWEIRESMITADVETVLQRARERYPEARPRIISDNGPQFIAKDFKEFIRLAGMTHVRTSPYSPQSNGKLEA